MSSDPTFDTGVIGSRPVGARVVGVVEHGDKRGRTIGFPTANIRLTAAHAALDDGVYAATVSHAGWTAHSAVSIGRRPTFYVEGERLLEAFLLDFDDDIYGERIVVDLVWHLRPQVRFTDVAALVDQLRDDVERCRVLLSDTDGICEGAARRFA